MDYYAVCRFFKTRHFEKNLAFTHLTHYCLIKKGGKIWARAPPNVVVAPGNRKFNLSQDGDVTL